MDKQQAIDQINSLKKEAEERVKVYDVAIAALTGDLATSVLNVEIANREEIIAQKDTAITELTSQNAQLIAENDQLKIAPVEPAPVEPIIIG